MAFAVRLSRDGVTPDTAATDSRHGAFAGRRTTYGGRYAGDRLGSGRHDRHAPGAPRSAGEPGGGQAAVTELRTLSREAEGHVREFTKIHTETAPAGGDHRRPARLDQGQRRGLPRGARTAHRSGSRAGPTRRRRSSRRVGLPRHRRRGGRGARLPRLAGARPVRAVPAAGPDGSRAARAADARRAQHRARRARAERRPARLPPLGVPARGDAPHAVHRGAVAARATSARR